LETLASQQLKSRFSMMKRFATSLLTSSVIVTSFAYSSVAHAETAAEANTRAQAALKAGRVHEACEAFEASNALTANVETELKLADCYEKDGRLMTASRLYASIGGRDPKTARRASSTAKAAALEARAPRLRFAINPRPDGLVIKVDGVEVANTGDVRVDLGAREVVATAPGFEGRASPALDREGVVVDVILRMKATATEAPKDVTPKDVTPKDVTPKDVAPKDETPKAVAPRDSGLDEKPVMGHSSSSSRKTYGIIAGAAGLTLVAGSAVMLGIANSKFSDEKDLCPNATCANPTSLARANALLSNGTDYRNIGIGVGIGGVVLLATGAYLLLTPHSEEPRVSFDVTRDGGSFAYTGRF
jgi:hypothetical protein